MNVNPIAKHLARLTKIEPGRMYAGGNPNFNESQGGIERRPYLGASPAAPMAPMAPGAPAPTTNPRSSNLANILARFAKYRQGADQQRFQPY